MKICLMSTLIRQLSLTLIDGIGPVLAKRLIAYCGGVDAIYEESAKALRTIPGINRKLIQQIQSSGYRLAAEREAIRITDLGVRPVFFLDKEFPKRLKLCEDAPILLFTRGAMDLNPRYSLSFVGTRKATPQGQELCRSLIDGLREYQPLIVSGLAFGIDIHCHRAALESNLPTVACLGHGLDRIYPHVHRSWVNKMEENGGVLSEFFTGTKPDRENFPKRNRLIAGLSDATIVVESDVRGGSMISAYLAQSYHREVMAVPGKPADVYSRGCNELIRRNVAGLITSPEHIINQLGWDIISKHKALQPELFPDLDEEEEKVYHTLRTEGGLGIDQLSIQSELELRRISGLLLTLELKGLVRSLPGKMYELR
jgi:DNA processing protein